MSNTDMNELQEKLIDLEIRLTHQEDHIHSLDKIIYEQDRMITSLRQQVDELNMKLKASSEANILSPSEEKPPPHY